MNFPTRNITDGAVGEKLLHHLKSGGYLGNLDLFWSYWAVASNSQINQDLQAVVMERLLSVLNRSVEATPGEITLVVAGDQRVLSEPQTTLHIPLRPFTDWTYVLARTVIYHPVCQFCGARHTVYGANAALMKSALPIARMVTYNNGYRLHNECATVQCQRCETPLGAHVTQDSINAMIISRNCSACWQLDLSNAKPRISYQTLFRNRRVLMERYL